MASLLRFSVSGLTSSLFPINRVCASVRYARAISPRLGLGVIADEEAEGSAAKEPVGAGPAAFAPVFSLDRRTSGSMMPNRAIDRSASFVVPWGEAAEFVFGLATLHTSPSTIASSAPTKFPAAAKVRQSENCWF